MEWKKNIIKNFGYVSRMDNIQAAFLNYKLKNLKSIILKEEKMLKFTKKLDRNSVFFIDERKRRI